MEYYSKIESKTKSIILPIKRLKICLNNKKCLRAFKPFSRFFLILNILN